MLLVLSLAAANLAISTLASLCVFVLARVQVWKHLRPLLFASITAGLHSICDVLMRRISELVTATRKTQAA